MAPITVLESRQGGRVARLNAEARTGQHHQIHTDIEHCEGHIPVHLDWNHDVHFWTRGRASQVAVEINYVSEEERKALNDFTSIVQALANLKKLDFDSVMLAVRASDIEMRRAWLKNAAIADEIVRVRFKKASDVAEACANLKIDPATTNIKLDEINNPCAVQRALSTHEVIEAEITRIRIEKEQEYDHAFAKLGKINETRAANIAKKHRREMDEERKRADASIEAEVARIRAEKAAKLQHSGQ